MKTKSKVIVLVEIALVLCSLFLVTLPVTAIAAEEDDLVLDIYGNANEDDTIDMRDLTYVKLIFFGKKPETELADAKYDGKINPLDFIQIKLIIVGKEKELTIVDSRDNIVTVKKPVEKIVTTCSTRSAEAIRAIGARDRIVGVDEYVLKRVRFFPEISKKESVGGWPPNTDIEKILELKPDVVIAYATFGHHAEQLDDKLKGTDIPVVGLDFFNPETLRNEMKILGYLLGEKENADKFLEWRDDHVNDITKRVSGISEDRKPKVFIDLFGHKGGNTRTTYGKSAGMYELSVMAGGRNIAADLLGMYPRVEVEWILKQNPNVIVGVESKNTGYETDDKAVFKQYHGNLVGLPGFEKISAVENDRVYIIDLHITGGLAEVVGFSYMAKWFHPDLFEDLDPHAIHQEYLTEFQGLDFDVSEQGIFVYHPEMYPDGR